MSNFFIKLLIVMSFFSFCACEDSLVNGYLNIHYLQTKAEATIPNTEDFYLTVSDSKGKVYYDGLYAESPEQMSVPSGSYTVSTYSCPFEEAAFDCPQFGDTQVVTVGANETVNVLLNCSQINSGIKIVVNDSFQQTFPFGELVLKGNGGSLLYSYDEEKTAFFKPGKLSVELSDEYGEGQSLFVRQLAAQEILTIQLSSSISQNSGGISIQLDTLRSRISEDIVYGNDRAGEKEGAFDITEAKENIGRSEVWVWGYIVGCANGSSTYNFEVPFEKNTNILIGLRTNSKEKDYLMSVELKSGEIRENLNLQYNSSLLGRKIYLKGDIVSSYFGLVGLKNVKEYQF